MLKQIRLNITLEQRKKDLAALMGRQDSFAQRKKDIETKMAVEGADLTALEADLTALERDIDEAKLETRIAEVEGQITAIDKELREIGGPAATPPAGNQERGGNTNVNTGIMRRLDPQQRAAFAEAVKSEQVREFLQRVRGVKEQTRAVTGGELGVPDVLLGLLRDNLHRYSKLTKHFSVRNVRGTARQIVLGAVPEGVWMEATGTLNELAFGYSQLEMDAYMVGGFIPIHNTLLADSDLSLASEIVDMLGQAIGQARDKAYLYGTGVKMPVGIVTRLAQAAAPSNWGQHRAAWTDLRATHLLKASAANLEALKLYQELLTAEAAAKANYSTGERLWAMSTATHNALRVKSLSINAAGMLVAAQNREMPIVGGVIELLDFIPNGDIIGGYKSLYLAVEREGAAIESSPHVQFLQNSTVFKGYERSDGQPVFGEGFIVFNINGTAPTTSVTFAADAANAGG